MPDNSGGIFPAVVSPEVMVTRRYYRSGEEVRQNDLAASTRWD